MSIPRTKIFWIGEAPAADCERACEERELTLIHHPGQFSITEIRSGKGVVLSLASPETFSSHADTIVELVQHGLEASVVCTFKDVPAVGELIHQNGLKEVVTQILPGREIYAIEQIARSPRTPSCNPDLTINNGDNLRPEDEILLRRAFSDCVNITLERQASGSTPVFRAFAKLSNSRAGPLPLPFFVKFGFRDKIALELENYRECTTLHVPFNQRPNLDAARCAFGHSRGVIVGNFVEQSESLQNVVDFRGGQNALHSLFEAALGGWRRQAFYEEQKFTATDTLKRHQSLLFPSRYSRWRRKNLRTRCRRVRQRTSVSDFDSLEQALRALPAIRYRWSLTHGDLHGDNVRVSGNESILIDFASLSDGPLTVDPASLDVSLLLGTSLLEGQQWKDIAARLYAVDFLRGPPAPPRPEEPAANLLNAIYYIRQIGFGGQLDTDDYPRAVALQLLRKASYGEIDAEDNDRRDCFYELADRIINAL